MFRIIKKEILNPTVTRMVFEAPYIAKKAEPGQFVILRVDDNGERFPLTISDYNREMGTISLVFQIVGQTTMFLNQKEEGDSITDLVGPLGNPTNTQGYKKVCVVGGGVGCAIAYPVAKKLHENGTTVYTITGFRNKDLVILNEEFNQIGGNHFLLTDDGSIGQKGLVTNALEELILSGEQLDAVIVIGPLVMMKYVCLLTKKYNIPTIASMNPIMIDGTGMCGGCRLSVGGETKFACVDGPDFDGHLIDFDECISRTTMYSDFEKVRREETCNLMKGKGNR